MAKNTGKLAGLAALAGAAYMMTRGKDKDKDAEFQKDRVDQTSKMIPSGVASPVDTTTGLKTQKQSIEEADKSNKATSTGVNASGTSASSISPISQEQSGTLTKGPDNTPVDLNQSRNAAINPKNPAAQQKNIVSKKQLDDYKKKFGQDKTLRDYMNAQRALKNAPVKPVQLPDTYKRGGATKMASGGMTASRRGDGIASRGKTKCKMY